MGIDCSGRYAQRIALWCYRPGGDRYTRRYVGGIHAGALAAGGLGSATLGSIAGHYKSGLGRGELKELGDALDSGEAGLVVVYAGNYAEQVGKLIKTENKYISQLNDEAADQLTAELKAAEGQK